VSIRTGFSGGPTAPSNTRKPAQEIRGYRQSGLLCAQWQGALAELARRRLLFWVDQACGSSGSTILTASLPVLEWLIPSVQSLDPRVIFLSEAFTDRSHEALGEARLQQSYTYFTWRTGKAELQPISARSPAIRAGVLPAELFYQYRTSCRFLAVR